MTTAPFLLNNQTPCPSDDNCYTSLLNNKYSLPTFKLTVFLSILTTIVLAFYNDIILGG